MSSRAVHFGKNVSALRRLLVKLVSIKIMSFGAVHFGKKVSAFRRLSVNLVSMKSLRPKVQFRYCAFVCIDMTTGTWSVWPARLVTNRYPTGFDPEHVASYRIRSMRRRPPNSRFSRTSPSESGSGSQYIRSMVCSCNDKTGLELVSRTEQGGLDLRLFAKIAGIWCALQTCYDMFGRWKHFWYVEVNLILT